MRLGFGFALTMFLASRNRQRMQFVSRLGCFFYLCSALYSDYLNVNVNL